MSYTTYYHSQKHLLEIKHGRQFTNLAQAIDFDKSNPSLKELIKAKEQYPFVYFATEQKERENRAK